METQIRAYFGALSDHLDKAAYSDLAGAGLARAEAFERAARMIAVATAGDNKLMIVGNGGSAGIASHMAIDFSKNGGMRALAFNDGSALTCLGNDLGYEEVFARQLDLHARAGDVLMAISSSGRSRNILRAVETARRRGCGVVTLSGFMPDNPLRALGDVNFYLPSHEYGFVEVGHLALIHCLLDLTMAGVLAAGTKASAQSAA